MNISVYTPSHDSRYLDEVYQSLAEQSLAEWEWVVLINGGAEWCAPQDPRVRVVERTVTGVGAAKRAAVAECRGEVLVEVDHDDLLTPNALERVAASVDAGHRFVYSDFAQVDDLGGYCADRFDESCGWTYHDDDVAGRQVLVCESMEASPHNASYIWYEPNHVKAFTRDLYDAAGGYDERTILDDQSLMCRMYQHADFVRLSECLYLQRVHAANTQRDPDTNARIQRETVELYDAYIQANALAWASRRGLATLDLGSAHSKPLGYLGVDLEPGDGVDLVGDVFSVLAQFPTSSVGVVRAVDFLEHIEDKVRLWNELYRVLDHGGMLLTLTPSSDGRGAFQDPTHCAYYNENSFWYFTDRSYQRYVAAVHCRFQTSRVLTYCPSEWHEQHHIAYVCFNGVAVKNGPRQGGRLFV